VSSSQNPSVFGQSVTFTATVSSAAGTPTGNVQFVIDGGAPTTVALTAGQATLTTSALTVSGSPHSVVANYQGSMNFAASSGSLAGGQTVNKANTITTVSSSQNPSVFGQSVTFTATVAPVSPGAGTPTGNVQFVIDGGAPTTVALTAGQATLSTSTLSVSGSPHSVVANYQGDTNFNTSGGTLTPAQAVNKANTTTAITSDSPDPSQVGQAVTVNYMVSPVSPGAGTPTGNVTVSDGFNSCSGTVAAGSCMITLTTAGGRTLTATYAGDGSFNGSTSAGEPHTVGNPPALSKSFTPNQIPVGQTSSLQFQITNSNSFAITGLAFSDTLPTGVDVANGSSTQCGGTLTTTAATRTIAFSGGSVNANSSCSFSVTVTGSTAGVKNNTTSTITSSNSGTVSAAIATLTVVAPPTITKAFSPTGIALNGTSTLTITITNPATNTVGLTGIGVGDTFPSGLQVDATPSQTNTCGGTFGPTPGAASITLAGGAIATPGNSCAISVKVKGATAGSKANTTGMVTSAEGGTGLTASATLNVFAPPTVAKAFSPTTVAINGISTLTITITNPAGNPGGLTGIGIVDNFPTGMQVDATPGATNTCGGTFAPAGGATSVTLSGGAIATAGNSCAISVKVKGTTSWPKNNTTDAVTSTEGGTGATASATLTVGTPPTISKAFGASTIIVNNPTSLTFSINNPNASLALTGVTFTDNLPLGLVVATPNGLSGVCQGSVTATAGSSQVKLTGGAIAAGGSCTIVVNVKGTNTGAKNNTTGAISSTETGAGTTSNTATVTVITPQDAIMALIGQVQTLVPPLNQNQANGLIDKLMAAKAALDASKTRPTTACSQLQAFINQVQGLTPNPLTQAQAQSLIAPANAIMASIGCGGNLMAPATVGLFHPANGGLYLKNHNITGVPDSAAKYGQKGDYPVVGDWDGDGVDTIGIYRDNTFYLYGSNTKGSADESAKVVVEFGQPGDIPVVGDWDGDGVTTIGVYRFGTFLLRNSNTPGPPDLTINFGADGDIPLVGDWDGDGQVTIGVYTPANSTFSLRNALENGPADIVVQWGAPGYLPIVGDWDGDGVATIGLYSPRGEFLLRNANTAGQPEVLFTMGIAGGIPVAGRWGGLP
jgi:hypothetical protein